MSNPPPANLSIDETRTPFSPTTAQPNAVLTPGPNRVQLRRRWGRYHCVQQDEIRNSLHNGVGFLELANACDFAANVFNQIPVPVYAAVLMGIGGAISLLLPYVAFVDAQRSLRNLRALHAERKRLRGIAHSEKTEPLDLAICLDTNFKEMGIEWVDRVLMDFLMGGGAVLVGVGTFMAIGGANPQVYLASNLMSGYLGNSFAAVYGLVNTGWATFVWVRAQRHRTTGRRKLPPDTVGRLLEHRIWAIKMHALIHGVTCLIAGAASLLTATRWWGYVILAPCIVGSIWCNFFFKQRVGYDRPAFATVSPIDEDAVIAELRAAHDRAAMKHKSLVNYLESTGRPMHTVPIMLEFIVSHNFFKDFVELLVRDTKLFSDVCPSAGKLELDVSVQDIVMADESCVPRLRELAGNCIDRCGPQQLVYRERYLLEILGNSLHYKARRESAPPGTRRLSLRRASIRSQKPIASPTNPNG